MRVLGDWTRKFYLSAPDLPVRIRIDGAYGQSIQSSRQFKTLMLIATGAHPAHTYHEAFTAR